MNTSSSIQPNQSGSGNQLLQDAEARFFLASIVDSLQDSVVTVNMQGIITSWNKGAERVYGYPASEAIGRSLNMVVFPEDFRELLVNIERIRRGEQIELYDTIRVHKDGQHMHIEVTLSPVKNDKGAVIGVSTLARDVTELRKTQEALRHSEGRMRAIFEAAVDFGIVVIDGDRTIVDWNKGAENMFGYSRDEAVGLSADVIFTAEDREAGMPQKEIETARNTARSIDERWHLHKDGTRFFMSGVMTPLPGENSNCFVKVARNITERKLAEEALFISEERKSLAIRSAEMGEWEWELATDLVKISEQVGLLSGFGGGEQYVSPASLLERVLPQDQQRVKQAIADALNGLNIIQTECRIARADNGEVKWVNVYGRVVAHERNDASKIIGVVYDITPRKVLEQQKDDFISLASHELKTPVTAIKTYSELLLEHLEDSGALREISLMQKMNYQVDRMTGLVKNLLDTSLLAEGAIKLSVEAIDINEVVENNLELLKSISTEHNLTWLPGQVSVVNADRERILQVITNFVANAAKYSPAHTDIIISTTDQQDAAVLRVQDRGAGISADAQAMIFARYYRGPHAPHQKGFGLGLYICAEIIRRHNGSIGVTSAPGEGSTFYFSLPYS